jgi:hypothetical protein
LRDGWGGAVPDKQDAGEGRDWVRMDTQDAVEGIGPMQGTRMQVASASKAMGGGSVRGKRKKEEKKHVCVTCVYHDSYRRPCEPDIRPPGQNCR